ncbi:MAG: sterol desaturase family protein [Chitinophagaceae bacterium]
MATYGKILLVAMPIFLLLVLFEKWYGWKRGKDTVRTLDMISSLSSGITNVTKDVLGLSLAILSYHWMVEHWSLFPVTHHWLTYVIAFGVLDLSGYWVHRFAHEYNFFWNNHIIHHSSEEFNLACALRQSISVFVRLFTVFLLPAALLGVPESVIAITAPLHLFAQFWYHTQHIGKMGIWEKIIVTPSHHRVHHAINPEYIDKNYAQIFIIWDKLFGTFQPELDSVKPVYGITRPVRTWNPIKINFQHLARLIRDAWNTQSWKDKLRIWWMPTGWRPEDVQVKYPLDKITDVYHFAKYDTPAKKSFKAWCWIQISVTLLLISYFFGNIHFIHQLHPGYLYLYGLFIFLNVYAYTDLMDRNASAWLVEAVKNCLGCYWIYSTGDWFGLQRWGMGYPLLLAFYFIVATVVVIAISWSWPKTQVIN